MHLIHCLGVILTFAHESIGRGVSDVFGICDSRFLGEQEVYICLGNILVLCSLGDAHGIDKDVCTLLGIIEGKILIVSVHGQKIARVVGRDRG